MDVYKKNYRMNTTYVHTTKYEKVSCPIKTATKGINNGTVKNSYSHGEKSEREMGIKGEGSISPASSFVPKLFLSQLTNNFGIWTHKLSYCSSYVYVEIIIFNL